MTTVASVATVLALVLVFAPGQGSGNDKEQGIRLFNEGLTLEEVAKDQGDLEQAVDKYQRALQIFRKAAFPEGIGAASNNLCIIHKNWSKYDQAVEYCEQALATAKELRNVEGEARTLNNLGLIYAAWRRYDKAVEYYEQALAIKRELKDISGEATTLNNLGLIYRDWGEYDKAVECYQRSLSISREIKDLNAESNALNNLGLIYKDWGQYDKAVDYFQQSLSLSRKLEDIRGEGLTLTNLGNVYKDWREYDKAVESFEKSLRISRRMKDPSAEGNALNNLGNVYSDRGEYDKAVEYYGNSLTINREINDPQGERNALNNLGIVYSYRGQDDKTADCYEKVLAISRALKDPKGEGIALSNLGNVHKSRGWYGKAVEYYRQAHGIQTNLKDRKSEANTLSNLGVVYYLWGQYDKAVEYYERSLAIAIDLKDPGGEGISLNNLANVFKNWGQYDKAVEYYEKSLAIRKEIKDPSGEGLALSNLGVVYADRGRHDKALETLNESLQIYERIGVPTHWQKYLIGDLYLDMGDLEKAETFLREAGYNQGLGRLYLTKSDYKRAGECYETVRLTSEDNRNADNLFASYTGLGLALEGIGDNPGAAEHFQKAIQHIEEMRTALSQAERAEFYNVRVWGFWRTTPYDGLARVLIKMNRPVEALKTSEYTKARVFAEALSKRGRNSGSDLPKEVMEKDSLLNEQLAAVAKRLQGAYEKQEKSAISPLEQEVSNLKDRLAEHVAMLRKDYPLFAAAKYPQPMALDETGLRDEEWVLAYHVTHSGVIVYATKGKDLVKALFKPIPRKDLDDLVLAFRKPLEIIPGRGNFDDKLQSFDFGAGKSLSDLLLRDVLELLPPRSPVIIVPDDSLGMLPFEALMLNDTGVVRTDKDLPYVSGAEFFGDSNIVSYYQSITALTLSRASSKTTAPREGLLALADPVFQEKDERAAGHAKKESAHGVLESLYRRLMAGEENAQAGGLRFTRLTRTKELVEDLAAMYKQDTRVYTGYDASKTIFLEKIGPKLDGYDKVVFATHGYFGKDLPGIMEPVLVLTLVPPGTDGYLRMTEVMGLNMTADIVVLTACQTGLGKRTAGEGTMGMGRAFQYAGARSVLMSLWSVSEAASVSLMKNFFRNLKEGKTKSDALAAARAELRARGFDHPFFWAGFILAGEPS
ncbi:MAG: tetratricopeptide repeat protein [Desulfomonile tiedjei]|nr:tetratricopeptide repeat protein [Desulfomonile tiedjei]